TNDRALAWSARRLLESLPVDEWKDKVLNTQSQRVLVHGGLALATAYASPEHSAAVIESMRVTMLDFVSDQDFVDMLRVMQVAIIRGELKPDDLADLKLQLSEEFPAGNPTI